MDSISSFESLVESFGNGVLPEPAVVSAMLENRTIREKVLAHAELSVVLAQRAAATSGIDCMDVENELDGYIDMEQQGLSSTPLHQRMRVHLRQCPDCYELYQTTIAILDAQASGELPSWPVAVEQVQAPKLSTVPQIVIERQRLWHMVSGWATPRLAMRGSESDGRRLVYAGGIPGEPDLFARVTVVRPMTQSDDEWQIVVVLQGRKPVADLIVIIHCGNETRAARTDSQGQVLFQHIPATWIASEAGPDLLVTLGPS